MSSALDVQKLAALIRTKRGKKGLRETADEIGGVSASTLSRIEAGRVPDLDTFAAICKWLHVSPNELLMGGSSLKRAAVNTPAAEEIEVILRADRELPAETADALVTMIRLAYQQAKRNKSNR
ncbi:MAG: helix-turn-helix domain-containing protein [Longimicrobiales bacterium]